MRYIFLKCAIILITILFQYNSSCFAYNYHLPIEKYKLPNGLTVILEEDRSSELVTIQLWIRTGSCYEGKFLGSGITHLVEHMVFSDRGADISGGKGEKPGSSTRIAKELQELGGELDASTSKEYTQFDITIQKDNIEKAMELIYWVITNADFAQEELEKEKEIVMHEMDTIADDPHKLLVEEYFKTSFQGHPYGEPVIGNKQLFQNITKEDLLEYYKSRYISRNMILVVAGDYVTENIKQIIEKIWGQIPDVFLPSDYIPNSPSVKGPIRKELTKNISSSYIILGFYGPNIYSEDVYPMDVLAEIAGGGKRSRLVKKLRDQLGLVSNISSWSYTPQFTGVWGVNADLVTDDCGLVVKDILKEIYRFRFDLVTGRELLRAKKQIMRMYLQGLETISGRASDLGSNEIYVKNPAFSTMYIRGISNVTRDDIKRVAMEYFNLQNFTLATLTREKQKMPSAAILEEKEITKLTLNNGMRILMNENTRLPLVTIRMVALGGLIEEEIPGLSYFTSQLWLKENPDLVKEIESVGGSISAYSGNNSIGCTIGVFKNDVPLALDVIKKLLQQFPITSSKVELARNIQLAEIKQEEDTPYGFAFKQAKNIFFAENPYGNSIFGTEESVKKISEKDIKGFFAKYLTPDNIVISIFGDVNTKELTVLVNNLENIQELKRNKAKEQYPLTPKINKETIQRETEQSIIILAYPCVSIYDEDRYAVELLTQIFSGQAGRLYENIREDKALSYSIGAVSLIGRKPGSFMFYIATNSENTKNAVEYLFNEVSRIKTEGVSEEELKRVKKYFVTQTRKTWESVSGLSLETALDELYGLGWDYYKKYIENIEMVTAENIKSAANKYFRDDWYTLVVVGPEEEQPGEARSE